MNTEQKVDWVEFALKLPDPELSRKVADVVNRTAGLSDQERWTLIEPMITGQEVNTKLPEGSQLSGNAGDGQQPQKESEQPYIPSEAEIAKQRHEQRMAGMNSLQRDQYYKRIEKVRAMEAAQ